MCWILNNQDKMNAFVLRMQQSNPAENYTLTDCMELYGHIYFYPDGTVKTTMLSDAGYHCALVSKSFLDWLESADGSSSSPEFKKKQVEYKLLAIYFSHESLRESSHTGHLAMARLFVAGIAVADGYDTVKSSMWCKQAIANGCTGANELLEIIWTCNSCGASGARKVCSNCKITRYCNRICQKAHWRTGGHENMCVKK
jgi:hypothetical protein